MIEAREPGGGWEAHGHDGATFASQADALSDTTTLAGNAVWMTGPLGPIPDGRRELMALATDADRGTGWRSPLWRRAPYARLAHGGSVPDAEVRGHLGPPQENA